MAQASGRIPRGWSGAVPLVVLSTRLTDGAAEGALLLLEGAAVGSVWVV